MSMIKNDLSGLNLNLDNLGMVEFSVAKKKLPSGKSIPAIAPVPVTQLLDTAFRDAPVKEMVTPNNAGRMIEIIGQRIAAEAGVADWSTMFIDVWKVTSEDPTCVTTLSDPQIITFLNAYTLYGAADTSTQAKGKRTVGTPGTAGERISVQKDFDDIFGDVIL